VDDLEPDGGHDGRPAPTSRFLLPLLAFAWPIVFFGDRVVPWRGTIRATGNDFFYLYYAYKAYLLDCLARFQFPLWSPGEGGGYPFFANPFTQAFYPLNAPLALFHSLFGGYSTHDHQMFTALGSGLLALGLFRWLRSLGHGTAPALLAACLVSTSFRMGDMLRLPNAVHTAAWFPWILLAFNRILGARSNGQIVRWSLGLFGFLIAFLTAGYLYFIYYAPVLFGPYLLLAAVPGLQRFFVPGGRVERARFGLIALVSLLALAVTWPYLSKVKQLLDATSGRTGADPLANAWYAFHLRDSFSSLAYPVGASPEGCFYFGLAGVLLIALYVVGTVRAGERGERLLCAVLVVWCLLVSSLSHAEDSGPFLVLKLVVPGLNRLRVWGRIGVVLLPLLAWLLARAFRTFQEGLEEPASSRPEWRPLVACYVGLLLLQVLLLRAGAHPYYGAYFPELARWAPWSLFAGLLAVSALGVFVAMSRKGPPKPLTTAAVLLLLSAVDVWPVGARLWSDRRAMPRRVRFEVQDVLARSLTVPRRAREGTISATYDPALPGVRLSDSANVAVIPEWYFARYARFLSRAAQLERKELGELLGLRDGRRLFLSTRIDHAQLRSFLDDSGATPGQVLVKSYDGDRLEARVDLAAAGFLTFVDNWDPDWRALVDGRAAAVLPVFGTFKGVAVPAGSHTVVFRYAPLP
jgi:hypothetical protein